MATTAYTSSYTGAQVDAAIGAVSGKADAATTLAGYGITDAYTKSVTDSSFCALTGGTDLAPTSSNLVNLNNLTTIGNYYCTSGADDYVSNKPTSGSSFRLWVANVGSGVKQRYQSWGSSAIYERYYISNSWVSWVMVQADMSNYPYNFQVYTRTESDDRYYTKTTSDSRFYTLEGGTDLEASSENAIDLDDYTTPGNYYNSTASVTSYISNLPSDVTTSQFTLKVMRQHNDGSPVRQRLQEYGAILVYERYSWLNVGGTLAWGPWTLVQSNFGSYLPLTGGTLTGALTVSADVTTTGDVYMDNAKAIYAKDTNNTNRELIKLSSSNNIVIGAGTIAAGGGAYIYGNSMRFRIGGTTDNDNALIIDSSKNAAFTGYIKATGDIYMAPATSTTNADSKKIYFRTSHIADTTNNVGPYIQAITNSSTYGRKRLSVFQVDAASYTDTYEEVFTILPNGRVGIGTVTPSALLGVNGDVAIAGSLSLGGNPVAVVYSGSTAPSSSTGSDGDIYIQTS